jgi:hypothetical protein
MSQPLRYRAVAVLLAASLGLGARAGAQPPALPSNMVAVLSLEPLDPVASSLNSARVTTGPAPAPGRLLSGFVPPECRTLQTADSPKLIDCWLDSFPRIAAAIRWEFTATGRSQIRSWPDWDEDSRQAVRDAFRAARAWRADGMRGWPGATFTEPPVNQEERFLNPDSVATVLDPETAFTLYATHLGFSLATEIWAWVPWSLRSYESDALEDLFDAPQWMFTYDRNDGSTEDTGFAGYSPRGAVTPAHPTTTLRFAVEKGLLGTAPLETITKVLEWSRARMARTFPRTLPGSGLERPLAHHQSFWGYRGKAPLSRILAGTRLPDPRYPAVTSWTEGCAMTSDTFAWLLRAVNVPARTVSTQATCGHAAPFFSSEGLALSHGDDPYDALTKTASFSAQLLLVRHPMWKAWFPNSEGDPWCWNVGRRLLDLNVKFPSEHLVGLHCADVLAGATREESRVLETFRNLYTAQKLKDAALWERLALRAETSTAEACVRLRTGR